MARPRARAVAFTLVAGLLVPLRPASALACGPVQGRQPLLPLPPAPSGVPLPLVPLPGPPADAPGYAAALRPSPLGWLHRRHWCVWVEPPAGSGAALERARIWHQAVEQGLAAWGELVSLERVADRQAAQVVVLRQRPPLRRDGAGRWRASHGRAEVELQRVRRQGIEAIEALVSVRLGADQRAEALAATALHELGHAFGLWGHSDNPADAMAASPGPEPVLRLSQRDRSTMAWLLSQPGLQTGASPFSLNTPSNSTELR